MAKKISLLAFLLASLLLAACGKEPTPAATLEAGLPAAASSVPTLDLCSGENLASEIKKIHDLTREFDDYAALASNTPQAQLVHVIPEMQRVMRDAEDLQVPACLTTLKQLQLSHMTLVIQTLMAFLTVSSDTDAERINAGILGARELRQQYDAERARLLGATLTLAPPTAASSKIAPAKISVTNNGNTGINLRREPDVNAAVAGILGAQATTTAFGKTADNQWIQVEIPEYPGQRAWVFASLVTLSAPIEQLPSIMP